MNYILHNLSDVLTHFISYRNHSFDLQSKWNDWFLDEIQRQAENELIRQREIFYCAVL